MVNLTAENLSLAATDGREPTLIAREGPVATKCIQGGVVSSDTEIDPGSGPIETATLAGVNPTEIENLNRLLEEYVRKDAAVTGRKALVLIDMEMLQHVHPRLRDRVAAPVAMETARGRRVTMLVFPPTLYVAPATPPGHKGYTLFLDRAELMTPTPATDEIGHTHTWQQLQWMARGAEPFERGGRLWARNDEHNTVLQMSDIRLDQPPPASWAGKTAKTRPSAKRRGA